MAKTIIAIDPGGKGFITALKDGALSFWAIGDHSREETADFIASFPGGDVVAVMEEVHAVFGSSAKATFAFGEVFGFLKGLVVACGYPYHLVQPKEWQREVWINEDKVWRHKRDGNRMVDTKATSINAARRLFPSVDLRRTAASRKADDNKADSLLICEYARRRNL